jgi:hypothetical protein
MLLFDSQVFKNKLISQIDNLKQVYEQAYQVRSESVDFLNNIRLKAIQSFQEDSLLMFKNFRQIYHVVLIFEEKNKEFLKPDLKNRITRLKFVLNSYLLILLGLNSLREAQDTKEIKQNWQEEKLKLQLTWLSVIKNQPDLFNEYENDIHLFLKSVQQRQEYIDQYKDYWEIIFEAFSQFPNLISVLTEAMQETIEMMQSDIYLTDDICITPLGWTANKYPELADFCNQISLNILENNREKVFIRTQDVREMEESFQF